MKKSLLAVAVAAALPFAAQAQTNVTMYGIADINVGFKNAGGSTSNFFAVESGGQATSRWGIRGTEDLGGGLSAIFNLEMGYKQDTGANDAAFFQRTATLGLAGGFGTIRLGRTYSPSFLQQGSWDVMGYGLYGNHLNWSVHPTNLGPTSGTVGSIRFSNGIFWNSPNWGGFTVAAAYAAGEANTDPKSRGNALSLAANYAAGPLSVGAYYDNENDTSNPVVKLKRMGIGGGWNFGAFRLLASYSKADPDGANNDAKFMSLGAGVKLGAGELLGQVTSLKQQAAVEQKTTTFGIAYVHPLSKRTNIYASYGQARNNDAVPAGTNAGVLRASDYGINPAAAGADPKGMMVGIRHLF
jgi:predicted porin